MTDAVLKFGVVVAHAKLKKGKNASIEKGMLEIEGRGEKMLRYTDDNIRLQVSKINKLRRILRSRFGLSARCPDVVVTNLGQFKLLIDPTAPKRDIQLNANPQLMIDKHRNWIKVRTGDDPMPDPDVAGPTVREMNKGKRDDGTKIVD